MVNIKHIAKLARLDLTDQEQKKFAKEIPAILDFVEKLQEVKTDKIEPTAQVNGLKNIVRNDLAKKKTQDKRQKILDQIPEKKDDYAKAKAIL